MDDLQPDPERAALESLLRWYVAMGVDAATDNTSHDRFLANDISTEPRSLPSAKSVERPPAPQVKAMPVGGADALVREAVARATSAPDIETLREAFHTLPGLALAATARMIFSGGTPGSSVMIVGGAPDSDDERQGEVFAGPAGSLLDAMLRAIGLDRSRVYITNLVPWRPPGNRPPTPVELSLCLPFARRHIALAAPRVILCLGERAAQPLLEGRDPISRLRGRWLTYEGDTTTVRLMATFSPSYLLSQPLQKRRAWTDLQMLAAELKA
jgi:DNA polymerase